MKKVLLSLLMVLVFQVGMAQEGQVAVQDFKERLAKQDSPQLIDVRTPNEFTSGHLENAKNIDVRDKSFKKNLEKLNVDQPLFLYCGSGFRSAKAAEVAKELGFKDIIDMKGGITAWKKANLPVE